MGNWVVIIGVEEVKVFVGLDGFVLFLLFYLDDFMLEFFCLEFGIDVISFVFVEIYFLDYNFIIEFFWMVVWMIEGEVIFGEWLGCDGRFWLLWGVVKL